MTIFIIYYEIQLIPYIYPFRNLTVQLLKNIDLLRNSHELLYVSPQENPCAECSAGHLVE